MPGALTRGGKTGFRRGQLMRKNTAGNTGLNYYSVDTL